MTARNATDIRVNIDGDTVAGATEGTISGSAEMLDYTNKDSGGDAQFIPGKRTWSVSSNYFVDFSATYGTEQFYNAWKNRTSVTVIWGDTKASGLEFSGSGYVSEWDATASSEDLLVGTATIQGTGALSKATTS